MARRAPARDNGNEANQDQAGATPAEATTGAAGAAQATAGEASGYGSTLSDDDIDAILPAAIAEALGLAPSGRALLAEACFVFGLDPNPKKKPREILSFRVATGDPDAVPATASAVTLVTGGGKKLTYPIDNATERILRETFGAWVVVKGVRTERPLPPDLTLPRVAVDGVVRTGDHTYQGGYLRSGGKAEADQRAANLAQLRASGKIR